MTEQNELTISVLDGKCYHKLEYGKTQYRSYARSRCGVIDEITWVVHVLPLSHYHLRNKRPCKRCHKSV